MSEFAIIETDDGLLVAVIEPGLTAQDTAVKLGGAVIDPGPYKTFDDANDALQDLAQLAEEERE